VTPGKLPRDISGEDFARILLQLGFVLTRQRGSHMVFFRALPPTTLVVPAHKVLKIGLLRKLIDQAGLTPDEFIELLG